MQTASDIRTGRHCVFQLHAHLVFVTKYRRKVFTSENLQDLGKVLSDIASKMGVELVDFNGEQDHVHILIQYPPSVALSTLVNSLKGASSRRLRTLHPEITDHYYKGVLWSPSYFAASCGGAPLEIIKQYIDDQNTPH